MKKIISFITTASGNIGLGHLIRSLSLAEMLEDQFDINFIIDIDREDVIKMIKNKHYIVNNVAAPLNIYKFENVLPFIANADIVVSDFYGITEGFQLGIKNNGVKLVCIDDLHEIHFYADIIINVSNSVSINNYSCEHYTQLLLGTDYVLLRPVFLLSAKAPIRTITTISSIFINMGGADSPNNSLKFLKAVLNTGLLKQIHVVLGLVNPHKESIVNFINNSNSEIEIFLYENIDSSQMNKILFDCQLAICPASGISMELCAVGIGMITGYTADNQKNLLKGLIDNNCAINIGDFNSLSEIDIISSMQGILNQKLLINEMITKQKQLIDGQSVARIRKVFQTL